MEERRVSGVLAKARQNGDMHALKVTDAELAGIQKFKHNVLQQFPNAEFVLYGSKARGDSEEFSDIDTLILLDREVTTEIEETIFRIAYDVDLEYDVVLSTVVESKQFWMSPLANAMPFHWSVDRDGIVI